MGVGIWGRKLVCMLLPLQQWKACEQLQTRGQAVPQRGASIIGREWSARAAPACAQLWV